MVARYLYERFVPADTFADACGIDSAELSLLIERGLVPRPAYEVDEEGRMQSFVFGTVMAPGAPAGRWFNPHSTAWVQRAREELSARGKDAPAVAHALEVRFRGAYLKALRDAHAASGPISGLVDAEGHFDEAAFDVQFPAIWRHFLAGTFGLCVAQPLDETRIVTKEVAQARLAQLTDNGVRRDFSDAEKASIRELIARYDALSMPFSPAEYARSSRKRLVEDILPSVME